MSDNNDLNVKHRNIRFRTFVILALVIITLQILGAYLEIYFLKDWQERSSFGDMFGAINTLFSGLAFAGVIYTILLQRYELELQRREIVLTRIEFDRSATAQEKSEKILALTAKLNALNSLAESSSRKLTDMRNRRDATEHIEPVKDELENYLAQIKECLSEMSNLSISKIE